MNMQMNGTIGRVNLALMVRAPVTEFRVQRSMPQA